jgi:hypothetical protein
MAGAKMKGRGIAVPDTPVLAMANRFERYNPETEKAVRKVEIVEDKTLKRMKNAFRKVEYDEEDMADELVYLTYQDSLRMIKRLHCTASKVEKFNIALAELQEEAGFRGKAGLFLSALINNSKDTEFVIHTNHLAESIEHLGCMNTKNIRVNGDAGYDIGRSMKSGIIIVKGNANYGVGVLMEGGTITVEGDGGGEVGVLMQGGIITVEGNAGDWVGMDMNDGTVIVKGDTGENVGDCMKGGVIQIEGEIGSISDDIGHGKIFHKGKLIVNK